MALTSLALRNGIDNFLGCNLNPRRDDFFWPFEEHFNKLFNEFFGEGGLTGVKARSGYPKWDILAEDGRWKIQVALPGLKVDDISVEILPYQDETLGLEPPQQRLLRISGKMSQSHQSKEGTKYHVKELRRSQFERTLVLPEYVKGEPEATMQDGILTLSWECPEAKVPERKKIPIRQIEQQ